MFAIFKREFRSQFQSVIGWLFLGITLFMFGLYFYVYNLVNCYSTITYTLSSVTFILLITVPILTMRVLAEERKNKTDQLILTAPVSLGKVVLGIYLALSAVFMIDVAVIALTPLFLRIFGTVSFGECYAAVLGYWLFGETCIAIGLFLSSLTESQVIAAVLTFATLFLGYMMSGITNVISSTGNLFTKIIGCYDLTTPLENFFDGMVDLTAVIYFVSLIALFLFLTVQSIQKRRWSMSTKKIKTGVFSTGFIAVALAAVVVVNLIGAQLPDSLQAIDMSSQKLYSITDTTKEVLDQLDEDITIYVLASESSQDATLGKTLDRYAGYSDHIKIEYKDPSITPTFYTNYTDDSVTMKSLIVESSKRAKVIDYSDIYESEIDYSTYSSTVTGYDGEGQLTSAIQYVTGDDMPVVYELTGHDESSISGNFKSAIEKQNITLESLNLLEVDEVPEDAEAIIINAPQKDFSQDDADKVITYLKNGGKAVITSGYTTEELTNFESILAEYQVTMEKGVLLESDRSAYYQMPYYLIPTAKSSTVTSDIYGDYIFLPLARGISYEDTSSEEDSSITYEQLLASSDSSYMKADPSNMKSYDKEEGDAEGPFTLGLAVSETMENEDGESVTTELYVFSCDSIFTDSADEMVSGNNSALFSGIISRFSDSEVSSVVPVKSYESTTLTISQRNIVFGGLVVMILVPLILIAAGIVIWVRRRRK